MDDPSGSGSSDLSLHDLMGEHSSRPSVAPHIWCIEYIAKFKKDLRCILAMMNMGLECPVDLGKRTNEVVALRILEFIFNPSKKNSDGISVTSASGPSIEFDLSLSSIDVLKAILEEIPLAELKPGMSELSKFNVLPFIAHKNSCLPRCALERLRDAVLEENQTNAAPSIQASEPVLRDEQPMRMEERLTQAGEEVMHIDQETMRVKDVKNQRNAASFIEASEPVLRDEQPRQIGEKPMHKGEEAVIYSNTSENPPASSRTRQDNICLNSSIWPNGDRSNTSENPPASSRTRQDNICVKCGKDGTLLVCSSRNCSAKVHLECLNSPVWPDENGNGNIHCPQCWYHQVTSEYLEAKNSMQAAKKKLVKFYSKLSTINKRLRG